jgi:hypothetical protein
MKNLPSYRPSQKFSSDIKILKGKVTKREKMIVTIPTKRVKTKEKKAVVETLQRMPNKILREKKRRKSPSTQLRQ